MKQNSRDVNISGERESKVEEIIKEIEHIFEAGKAQIEEAQIQEIRLCLDHGLTTKQILTCLKVSSNKLSFNADQMHEIRLMHENGIPLEQISSYTRCDYYGIPIFEAEQMHEIRLGIEHGLTYKQVSMYAKPEFDCGQMEEMRLLFQALKRVKKVSYSAVVRTLDIKCLKFNSYQKKEIVLGIENELTIDQIAYSAIQMQEIRLGFIAGLSLPEIQLISRCSNILLMKMIRLLLISGRASESTIQKYIKQQFSEEQLIIILLGYGMQFSEVEVDSYANITYSTNDMIEKYREISIKHNNRQIL